MFVRDGEMFIDRFRLDAPVEVDGQKDFMAVDDLREAENLEGMHPHRGLFYIK